MDSTADDITPFYAIMNDIYTKDISKEISNIKCDKQGLIYQRQVSIRLQMYSVEKNKIVIDESVASMVRQIFSMALEGMSCQGNRCLTQRNKNSPFQRLMLVW